MTDRINSDDRDRVRDKAARLQDRASSTAQTIASNPLGIVVGGLALGALAGTFVPRSEREKEILAPLGKRLEEAVRLGVQAAREAGMNELEQRGLTKDAARGQAKGLLDNAAKALSTAGTAAARAASGKPVDTDH